MGGRRREGWSGHIQAGVLRGPRLCPWYKGTRFYCTVGTPYTAVWKPGTCQNDQLERCDVPMDVPCRMCAARPIRIPIPIAARRRHVRRRTIVARAPVGAHRSQRVAVPAFARFGVLGTV